METGTLSYELLLKYLALCVSGGHDGEVSEVYDIMRGSFASLDTGASTLFIKSFSRTERWREALHILSEVKRVLTPSARNYGDIIAGAVEHGDAAAAWALYEELIGKGLSPHEETWDALFKRRSIPQPDDQDKLLQILLYMRDNQIYPGHSLASTIKSWFERYRRRESVFQSTLVSINTLHILTSVISLLTLVSRGKPGQAVGPEPPQSN